MAKKPALITIKKDFIAKIDSANDLFDAVQPLAFGNEAAIKGNAALFPGQARRVVGLAFMQMVMAMEDLVEASLVRYLAGATSPSGYAPPLRLSTASSLGHAYQLLSGNPDHKAESQYLSWTDWGATIKLAKVFLKDGEPFSSLTPLERSRLADSIKIRNRVAHFSGKCRSDFNAVARSYLGLSPEDKLKQGYMVGQLLVEKSNKHFGPSCGTKFYFKHFHKLFTDVGTKICPS
jgi:hypothetical protein